MHARAFGIIPEWIAPDVDRGSSSSRQLSRLASVAGSERSVRRPSTSVRNTSFSASSAAASAPATLSALML